MPGFLMVKDTGQKIPCQSVDVSHIGIGIISPEWLVPDAEVVFVIPSGEISLELVWGMLYQGTFYDNDLDLSPQNVCYKVYRYGLKATDETFDLARFFAEHGCIDNKDTP
jgi:hypothetical protein